MKTNNDSAINKLTLHFNALCLVFPQKPRLNSKILNGGMIVPSPFYVTHCHMQVGNVLTMCRKRYRFPALFFGPNSETSDLKHS